MDTFAQKKAPYDNKRQNPSRTKDSSSQLYVVILVEVLSRGLSLSLSLFTSAAGCPCSLYQEGVLCGTPHILSLFSDHKSAHF
jgi:hypothetical protein